MKVQRLFIQKEIKDLRDLFKEKVTHALGYRLSDDRSVYLRELLYYGLKNCTGVEYPIFSLSYESLLKEGYFALPRSRIFNKFNRSLPRFIIRFKKMGIVKYENDESHHSGFLKWLRKTTHELASNFQDEKKLEERLENLEEKYNVDTSYLQGYGIDYESIKKGKQLISDKEINKLERFFGNELIVPRWKKVEYFALYDICEKILEGWKENERINQFIKERNIGIPNVFKAKIKPPKDLLEDASLLCDEIVAHLIVPHSLDDIKRKFEYRSEIGPIVSILNVYGIIRKENAGYTLNSSHSFKIAGSKLSRRIERFRKYVKALELKNKASVSEISRSLDVNVNVIFSWISEGVKPFPISHHTAELLVGRGVMSSKELGIFESYGLIR